MANGMNLITVEHLRIEFGGHLVLDDIDLSVTRGEIVTIVGPNGSGKTTLLRAMIGALRPTAGRVVKAPGTSIGYVPQRLQIDGTMPLTVERFLGLAARRTKGDITAMLDLTGVADCSDRQIGRLSGGQLQRVLLARALVGSPDLLLLDEPTQGLDQPATAAFYRLITEVRAQLDCTILMVSHDLHVVFSASDRVICLNGHICCHGTPQTVASAPEYRALFGPGTQGTLALYRHAHDHAHDYALGHDLGHDHDHHAEDDGA